MNQTKKIVSASLLTSVALLSACSSFGRTDLPVMQIAKDSYNVRALSERSVSTAKQLALVAANKYCKENGNRNVMLVKDFSGTESDTNEKFYDITFMCLAQGDRDFTRISHDAATRNAQPKTLEWINNADTSAEGFDALVPQAGSATSPITQ